MNSSWKRDVVLSLMSLLGDMDVVIYTLDILKPLQRDYEEQKARDFHLSLRTSDGAEERDQSIPVRCGLPFNGRMWRRSKKIQLMIRYFREGFMRTVSQPATRRSFQVQCISDKAKTINRIYAVKSECDRLSAIHFRSCYSIKEIEEALYDYELLVDDEYINLHQTELPILLTTHPEGWSNFSFITIVN
jgi:hypothetical protein